MPLSSLPAVAAVAAALVPVTTAHAGERGALMRVHPIARLSRADTAKQVAALGLSTTRVRHGVDAFRLTYATVGVDGATPTTATGLVVLPRTRTQRLPTVSYAHGTMAARADVPSRDLDSLGGASVLLFAGAGFATVAPDYLGLGHGPGHHPYLHAASEATASLDLLRAAQTFAARRHRTLDHDVLVTGFSQGGQAAMALGRLLQDGADPGLRLRALAPMSGPYDIEHAQLPATLDGRMDPRLSTYYLSYLMLAWQPTYRVFADPRDVWKGPWSTRVARLFDGRHDDVAILGRLPDRLPSLFTPGFLARLGRPDGGLLTALEANDTTCAWAPHVPTRIYAARGDRQVAFANSTSCVAQLRAQGADPRLIDVGAIDHFPSTQRAAPRVVKWFLQLR